MELVWDTTKPIVASGYVTPNPGSGTVNVTIVFTELLSDLNVSIAPHVYVNDGSNHAVNPVVDGNHTHGYNSDLNIWE